jgi:hypothetical protein
MNGKNLRLIIGVTVKLISFCYLVVTTLQMLIGLSYNSLCKTAAFKICLSLLNYLFIYLWGSPSTKGNDKKIKFDPDATKIYSMDKLFERTILPELTYNSPLGY